ncbi:NupC/NupG family nucleoside CNT transporter [Providencia heimbachae]|uniref:Nucleoside permease n=1 Tax=Providencia heimbachae ATCC 35613 TaxID=1354272 RepID=A0A1B7K430_9GAMM|nr:NupC/NupG family nucleoside CNT transporter [Providencia heimbachae]OAT54908.1 nucleoside permease [Providencia heimbachae ATCC 35613]SQH13094.1 Nucleoside permease nupX [Providencia heimbachae]
MPILTSIIGMMVLISVAVLFSSNRRQINLRTVIGAFILQATLGAFVLYIPAGRRALAALSDGVSSIISYGQVGTDFIFGGLVSDKMFDLFGGAGFVFALRVLPAIVFFSSLIAVLYYLGIMTVIINIIGGGLHKLLGTSRTESLSATANIFVGLTEAPLVIRPYLPTMTRSELFAVMCGGAASIAGSILAGYALLGVKLEYLLAASFMAAPGGLLFAKLLLPETEKVMSSEEIAEHDAGYEKPANLIDAAAGGAASGMQLAMNVGAMLLAFIALIAMLNGLLGYAGSLFDYPQLSLELILGWVFSPVAYLLGIPWSEANFAGSLIGQKFILNEFVAYSNLSPYLHPDADVAAAGLVVLSEHTKAVISFALCGFANISAVAILLGGIGSLAPSRRKDVAQLGFKAVCAGTLSNLMSAALASFFLAL